MLNILWIAITLRVHIYCTHYINVSPVPMYSAKERDTHMNMYMYMYYMYYMYMYYMYMYMYYMYYMYMYVHMLHTSRSAAHECLSPDALQSTECARCQVGYFWSEPE